MRIKNLIILGFFTFLSGILNQSIFASEARILDSRNLEREARVDNLPEDGSTFHISIFVSPNWKSISEQRNLVVAFESNTALKAARSYCFYHRYTTNDPIYKERFSFIKEFPCVIIQAADGKVLYRESGNISVTEVMTAFEQRPWLRLRPWLRPRPHPCPGPEPEPSPEPTPEPAIDEMPNPVVIQESSFPWPLLLICVALSASVMGLIQWKRRTA